MIKIPVKVNTTIDVEIDEQDVEKIIVALMDIKMRSYELPEFTDDVLIQIEAVLNMLPDVLN